MTDSRLTKKRVAIALVVLAFVIGGLLATRPPPDRPDWARCTPNAPFACTVLDGVALGVLRRSWDVNGVACRGDCPQPIDVARAELELRAPGHPAVKAIGEYAPDRLALCGEVLCAYSGYLGIFVFDVGDARPRPIVVSCPGVAACRVIDRYGEANG